jgi:hypothetical protein
LRWPRSVEIEPPGDPLKRPYHPMHPMRLAQAAARGGLHCAARGPHLARTLAYCTSPRFRALAGRITDRERSARARARNMQTLGRSNHERPGFLIENPGLDPITRAI